MSLSDPVADMLTRVRNAHMAEKDIVEVPHSKFKTEIARILKQEGFITDYVTEGGVKKTLRLYLKYTDDRQPAIRGLRCSSHPGLHRYVKADKVPRVQGGMGIAVLSTSSGIMTDREARHRKTGGELVCCVW
jgi:small subunit ribosomal protein S8